MKNDRGRPSHDLPLGRFFLRLRNRQLNFAGQEDVGLNQVRGRRESQWLKDLRRGGASGHSDALVKVRRLERHGKVFPNTIGFVAHIAWHDYTRGNALERQIRWEDRKSTRLNSSHSQISYAVFCLKKKTIK